MPCWILLATAAAPSANLYVASCAPLPALEAFIRFLIDSGRLGRAAPADDAQEVDESRLVNYCVILAGRLGLDHGYTIDRIFFGPHSDELNDDYYGGAAARARAGLGGDAPALPASFARDRFLRVAAGKSDGWMETAASLIAVSHLHPDTESLAEWFGDMAGGHSPEHCRSVVRELTSPEIGIVLDCDKHICGEPWQAAVVSATHHVGEGTADGSGIAGPIPVAAGS